ncbi:hypothetical protein JCM8097_006989 [Rhodosporidiobolus ruineniae]
MLPCPATSRASLPPVNPVAKIAVIFYSTYGHVRTLAETIAEEARANGAEVDLLQIPEILSEEVRGKMHAAPRAEYPDVTAADLEKYDGYLFGAPTRYGRVPAAVSAFFDTTGGLWFQGKLTNKLAGMFTSTAGQHGGQETTVLTTLPFFVHHGIIYVPNGYGAPELSDNTEIVGGSAYGAAAIAGGDGSRGLTEKELAVAKYQAKHFTGVVKTFVAGKSALEKQAVVPKEETTTAVTATSAEPATLETGEPVLGKAVPTEAAPYEVEQPAAEAPKEAAATPAAAESTAAPTPAPAAEPAATPAVVEEKPAAAATPAPAQKKDQPKKKGGIFSMCCGGNASNYDN